MDSQVVDYDEETQLEFPSKMQTVQPGDVVMQTYHPPGNLQQTFHYFKEPLEITSNLTEMELVKIKDKIKFVVKYDAEQKF